MGTLEPTINGKTDVKRLVRDGRGDAASQTWENEVVASPSPLIRLEFHMSNCEHDELEHYTWEAKPHP